MLLREAVFPSLDQAGARDRSTDERESDRRERMRRQRVGGIAGPEAVPIARDDRESGELRRAARRGGLSAPRALAPAPRRAAVGGVPALAPRLGALGLLRPRRADGAGRRHSGHRAPRPLSDPRAAPHRRRREGRRRPPARSHPTRSAHRARREDPRPARAHPRAHHPDPRPRSAPRALLRLVLEPLEAGARRSCAPRAAPR